jgi:hypothetical protein
LVAPHFASGLSTLLVQSEEIEFAHESNFSQSSSLGFSNHTSKYVPNSFPLISILARLSHFGHGATFNWQKT